MTTGRYDGTRPEPFTSPQGVTVMWRPPAAMPSSGGGETTAVRPNEVHRLDLIAFRLLGDATLAWRLAEANDAMNLFDLVAQPGLLIRLPDSGL